ARDTLEIDDNQSATGTQGSVDRSHRLEGIFEMMIGIADEGQIDGFFRQLYRVGLADHADHVFEALFLAGLLDIFDELGGNIHGMPLAPGADLFRKKAREQSGAGADVAHGHAGLELSGSNDVLTFGEDFPALEFKFPDELLDIRILERLVD